MFVSNEEKNWKGKYKWIAYTAIISSILSLPYMSALNSISSVRTLIKNQTSM